MITLLAKLTAKELLVIHLEEALDLYRQLPIYANFQRLAMCATLIAMKESADSTRVHELLEHLASDTILHC
jgi:hypothetical protein